MSLRSPRERVVQTLWFEAGGLALAAPLYAAVFDRQAASSLLLLATLSGLVLVWTPVHNALFDLADLRLTGRVASDRPHGLRLAHAVSHEVTAILLTLPAVMLLGGHGLVQALGVNATLTAVYVAYAYVFHIAYDTVRPVRALRSGAPSASPRRKPAHRILPRSYFGS